MTVYVDDMRAKLGRMVMCHMIADNVEELHKMANLIGVSRKWFQGDHYDICLSKRTMALHAGAVEVTRREMVPLWIALQRKIIAESECNPTEEKESR